MTQVTNPLEDVFRKLEINFDEIKEYEQIGTGGFGKVYRGTWQNEEVAIKKIALTQLNDKNAINSIVREAEIMAKCVHPRIVRFYGLMRTEASLNFIMEYVKTSLDNLLQYEPTLPWPFRLKIAIDTTRGLKFLHTRPKEVVLHRDLKSMNILVDAKYHAKICDFGQAKFKEMNPNNNTAYMGTPKWKAPELLEPNNKPTEKSDIYSLGLVFWEIASGKRPYENCNDLQAIAEIIRGNQPEIAAEWKAEYKNLIAECFHKEANSRPTLEYILDILMELKRTYKKPWRFDFAILKPKNMEGKPFKLLDVPNTSDDFKFIKALYDQNPDPEFEIDSVQVPFNPSVRQAFKSHLALLQKRAGNQIFAPQWLQDESHKEVREQVDALFRELTKNHSDPFFPHVKFMTAWHGVKNIDAIENIFVNMLAALGTTDEGFFGKGIYGTPNADYAHRVYSKKNGYLLLNWLAIHSAFPVVGQDGQKFVGKNHHKNYDAHFIKVVPRTTKADEVNYDAWNGMGTASLSEVVVFEKGQCLPAYLVKLKKIARLILPVQENSEKKADNFFVLEAYNEAVQWYLKALQATPETEVLAKAELAAKLGRSYEQINDSVSALSFYYQSLQSYAKVPHENAGFILSRLIELQPSFGIAEMYRLGFLETTHAICLRQLSSLRLVSWHGGYKVTNFNLRTIANNVNSLSSLVIDIPFVGNFPSLEILNLSQLSNLKIVSNKMSQNVVSVFSKIPLNELKTLEVGGASLTVSCNWLLSLKNLTSLIFLQYITEDEVNLIVIYFPQYLKELKTLYIYVFNISDSAIQQLHNSLPKLDLYVNGVKR